VHVSPGLVERVDLDVHVRVLAEDLGCVVIRVERVHQNQRHVRVVLLVQILHVTTQNLHIIPFYRATPMLAQYMPPSCVCLSQVSG